ncbi:patatin-like phospholipase family protein [Neptunicella marina]|uniref:Patatin-like phospholipase family protein n=1 Tax=Neptunicella marina TaxID=2125989 RepID=A0A8J6LVV8_9ALTE|nr:patatin-like phospholipase family protein [Neptunicella marina]MBC3764874.1 patatin-like phospholipase family protein [Neptunicella marina]
MTERNQFALMLSGGGARAAYQVGVLKAVTNFLPRNQSIPFPIICGTSAGAINATTLACFASCYHLGVRKLDWVWKNLTPSKIYESDFQAVFGHIIKNYFKGTDADNLPRATSLLNNQPLRQLLRKTLDFDRLDNNIQRGVLKAICITASSYTSHDSISFFQSNEFAEGWERSKRRGLPAQLNVEHLMASAAIPLVFPSVKLGNDYFGDGSVHQLSPLSAPIHLGANRIFVIGVDQPEPNYMQSVNQQYPSASNIAGHLLDTIFADTLNADLERAYRINETLGLMTDKQRAQTHLRPIECLEINPSENFNEIAANYYHRLPGGIRTLLRMVGLKPDIESSLPSYLLFDSKFCEALIDVGYHDAMARQDEIRDFLML